MAIQDTATLTALEDLLDGQGRLVIATVPDGAVETPSTPAPVLPVGGYGEILRASGRSLEEMLANLDQLHTRVRLGMPHLKPPSFRLVRNADGSLTLHYSSERRGLAPCVVGLVKGLAKRFGETVTVEHVAHRSGEREQDEFRIVRLPPA